MAGPNPQDPQELPAAAHACRDLGADLLAAQAATAAAIAFRRTGRTRSAAAATQLADTWSRCTEGARTPGLTEPAAAAALTDREKEIALLAADGITSQTIADQLILSVRTVENHLQRTYAKLGVSRRAELTEVFGRAAAAR